MSKENPLSDHELAELAKLCLKWWNVVGDDGSTLSDRLSFVIFVAEKELDRRMFPEPEERKDNLEL